MCYPTPIPTGTRNYPPTQLELPNVDGKTWTNSIGMEFVLIPAGTFMMGSPDSDEDADEDEKPAHSVTISQPFYLGKYSVTQAQWEAVMDNNPSRFKGPHRPIESVSWDDVQAFLRKLNERERGGSYCLPTEARWEYACRAGTVSPRYHHDVDAIAWYEANSNKQPHPVGEKLPNAWGLYDMLGNVWEWCHDGHRKYTRASLIDPIGLTGVWADRSVRGGGWDDEAQEVRAADRFWVDPGLCIDILSFRCLSSGPSR
jgi:formylglycine-generating enzyme required for sulfatase activity